MTTLGTIKKLAASTAIAGSLGIAALSLGAGLAAAAPSTGSGSGTSSTSHASSPSRSATPTSLPQQLTSQAQKDGNAFQTRVSQLKSDYTTGRITAEEFSNQVQAENQASEQNVQALTEIQESYDRALAQTTSATR